MASQNNPIKIECIAQNLYILDGIKKELLELQETHYNQWNEIGKYYLNSIVKVQIRSQHILIHFLRCETEFRQLQMIQNIFGKKYTIVSIDGTTLTLKKEDWTK